MKWEKKDSCSTIRDVFLRNVGAKNIDEVNGWFKKSREDGYRLDGIDDACDLITRSKDGRVTIIGDYDSDGVNASAIAYLTLKRLGFKDVHVRIPRRFSEGYGLSEKIIDEIDSGLVITVDNGIAAIDEIKKAKAKGLSVIVTDHHLPVTDGVFPPADIVIDPKAIDGSSDFDGYCGAGVMVKIARRLLGNDPYIKKLFPFAGIATVTDVMPLREENYVFVRESMPSLITPGMVTTGLYALVCALNLNRNVSSKDIGFKIGPTINAASRMKDDGAIDALRLLCFDGPYEKAIEMAEALIKANDERKEAKKEGLQKARKVIEDECLFGDAPLVINVPDVQPGIVGILAGELAEEYRVPVFVMSGDDILKGSARSFGGYDIKKELDKISDTLLGYGGHVGAAGFSVEKDKFEAFKDALQENFLESDYKEEVADDTILYDLEIDAKDIPDAVKEVRQYEPFGEGNPEIVFKVNGFDAVPRYGAYYKTIGDGSIAKLYSVNATAIGFGLGDRFSDPKEPVKADMIGILSENYFGSTKENQIEFLDFFQKKASIVETPLAKRLKAMANS